MAMPPMTVFGADGCKGGWVFVRLEDGDFAGAEFYRNFAAGVTASGDDAVIAVDIPIGYPAPPALERAADNAARNMVGPLRNSVFPALHPDVLWVPDKATAHDRWRALTGRNVNPLSLSLAPKMREVDVVAADHGQVYEVHPEVSFRALADRSQEFVDRSLAPKSQWNGHTKRRALLAEVGIVIPDPLGQAGAAGSDDILDAAAAAWSANRIAAHAAASLPNPPEPDGNGRGDGRLVAIWY